MEKVKADIWMPLYIGDYLADTMHLTTEQHGAYLLLLMAYWKNGGPLPGNDSALASICRLSGDAWSNARAMLVHFFSVDSESGTWRHGRIDQELGDAAGNKERRVSKAKAAAEARWAKDAKRNAPSMPEALPGECPSPSPVLKEEVPKGTCDQQAGSQGQINGSGLSYRAIQDAYNRICVPTLAACRTISKKRQTLIKSLVNLEIDGVRPFREHGVPFAEAFFTDCLKNPHWTGNNDRGWKANFDFLIRLDNAIRVLEENL